MSTSPSPIGFAIGLAALLPSGAAIAAAARKTPTRLLTRQDDDTVAMRISGPGRSAYAYSAVPASDWCRRGRTIDSTIERREGGAGARRP